MTNVDILYKTIEQGREGKNKGFNRLKHGVYIIILLYTSLNKGIISD